MTDTPLFSIIVPVYKVEKYLNQCIDSLLKQDFNNYEIILVDDGSPDTCPRICDGYAERNKNIRVLHKENGGLSDARNKGVEVANGEYLTFVDSDDFWKGTDILTNVAKIVDRYNPDIVVSDFIKYYSDNNKYLYPKQTCDLTYNGKSKIEILRYLYFCHADMKISAWQKFAKRELLTRNPFVKGLLSEDIDWTLAIYTEAQSICVYNKPYYCYRQMREGSITYTASTRSFKSILSIINNWKDKISKLYIPKEEKSIYLGYLAYQISILLLIINNLPIEERLTAFDGIKKNTYLFSYPRNYKTKKVKTLIDLCGLHCASKILFLFHNLRSSFLKR